MSIFTQYNAETGVVFDRLDDIINNALDGVGGGGTATPTNRTPYADYSPTELRQLWRAGRITEEQWKAELIARGSTDQAAVDEIARQKNVGISTAAKTKGQLTPSELAAVEAYKASAPTPTPEPQAPPVQEGGRSIWQVAQDIARLPGQVAQQAREEQAQAAATPAQTPAARTQGGGGTGGRTSTPAAPKPYTFGRDSAGLPVVKIASTGQVVHLPPGTEADDLETIMSVVNAASRKPLVFDYYQDAQGKQYAHIYETGKTLKLPDGISEDSVALQYHILQNLPKESPNLMEAMQNLERARVDQGHDEFGRPYQQGTTATRYSAAPLPEDMPTSDQFGAPTQAQLIREGNLVDESGLSSLKRGGLNFDLYGDPRFVRQPSGSLVIDYNEAGNGVTGPTIMGNRVYANPEEAADAEYALGLAAASQSVSKSERDWEQEAAAARRKGETIEPYADFAYGGELKLHRPTRIVDIGSGQTLATAAMNGPERVAFGGERYSGGRGFADQLRAVQEARRNEEAMRLRGQLLPDMRVPVDGGVIRRGAPEHYGHGGFNAQPQAAVEPEPTPAMFDRSLMDALARNFHRRVKLSLPTAV